MLSYLCLWNLSYSFLQDSTKCLDAQTNWIYTTQTERLLDASYYFSFLVFCIKHLFVIWVSKTNLTIFCMIQTDISMHKNVKIFTKKFYPVQNVSCSKSTLSIFLFFEFLRVKPIISIAQNSWNASEIFNTACIIIVPHWRCRNQFLCKALIYLPNKDVKPLVKMVQVFGSDSPNYIVLVLLLFSCFASFRISIIIWRLALKWKFFGVLWDWKLIK